MAYFVPFLPFVVFFYLQTVSIIMRCSMRKRIIALLLAFCMAMSLAACGKKEKEPAPPPVVEKTYASDQAMDVFETLETVRHMKEFTFELQINHMDEETGEPDRTMMAVSGVSGESGKYADLSLELEGVPFTRVILSGNQLMLNVKQAALCLADRFGALRSIDEEEKQDFADDLKEIAEACPTEFALFTLPEDIWSSVEQGGLSQPIQLLTRVYDNFKKDTASKVRSEKNSCVLTVGMGDLQAQLSGLTASLLGEEDVYRAAITSIMDNAFPKVLEAYGMSGDDWFDTKWEKYYLLQEELDERNALGQWVDWTVRLVTCGEESSGYTIDFTDNREEPRNYVLSVYPVEKTEKKELPETFNGEDVAEPLSDLYASWGIYQDLRELDEEEAETEPDDNGKGDEMDGMQLITGTIEGGKHIKGTVITTEDGIDIPVPVPAYYDSAEAEQESGYVSDIYLNSNGYVLEYTNMETRDPKEMVEDTLTTYEEVFGEDYEYPLTTKRNTLVSKDGRFAIGGMGYYDEEEQQDVTVLTGSILVPDSEYCIGLDIFIYSRSVTDKEIAAMEEMLTYLGAGCPVTITKN